MEDEEGAEMDASPDEQYVNAVTTATGGKIVYYVCGASNSVINVQPTIIDGNNVSGSVPPNVRAQMDAELNHNAGIFQPTSGFNNCLDTLRKHGSLVITATPGDGKTMVASGIARHLRDVGWGDGTNCTPLVIKNPDEWRRYVDPKGNQLILIDDIFGSHNLSKDMLNRWLPFLYMVEACLAVFAGRLFVVITCRKTVLAEAKEDVKKFQLFDTSRIVNLSAEENLTAEDMKRLILSHKNRAKVNLSEEQIDRIVHSSKRQGFPRTCRLLVRYGADPDGLEAQFQNPTDILMDELLAIFKSPWKKALMYLLMLCDGNIDISKNMFGEVTLPWYGKVLDMAGLQNSTPFSVLIEEVPKIPESYIIVEDEGVKRMLQFSHPSVFSAVARLFSKTGLTYLVEHCSMKLLTDLIRLERDGNEDSSTTITIMHRDMITLVHRFLEEIKRGNCRPVFSHEAMCSIRFVERVLDAAKERGLLKQILPRDKKTQLSLLYWSVWNKRGIMCRSLLRIGKEPKSKVKFDEQDRFIAIVGAIQCGNIEALTSLLSTFTAKILKKSFQRFWGQVSKQCEANRDWESLLDLACMSKKEEAVGLILKHQRDELDSKDIVQLLSLLASRHDCDMFLFVFEQLPYDILQTSVSIITLPKVFSDHIARIVKVLCKCGAETKLTVTTVSYTVHVLAWKLHAKFTEIQDEEMHAGTYTVKLTPRMTLYARRKEGYCPQAELYKLALAGQKEIVELMILLGTDADQESREYGETVLFACCRENLLPIVECLVKHGADVNLTSGKDKRTPLLLATEMGNTPLVCLLSKSADVNIRSGKHGTTPLISAVGNGDKESINILLQNRANVNLGSLSKETPLNIACSNLDVSIVSTLVEAGADVNLESGFSHERSTPLIKACGTWNSGAIVKILVDHGADVNRASGRTKTLPLHLVCEYGNRYALQCLLEKDAELPGGDEFTDTLLNTACRSRDTEMAEMIIDYGDNVNKKSGPQNETPLLIACTQCDASMVKLLLRKGADINLASGHHNISPLHMACSSGFKDIVSVLLRAGAEVNTKREMDNLTPLYVTCLRRVDLVDELLESGADVNMKNGRNGDTVLHLMSGKGESAVVEKLIGKGGDVNMKNVADSETPLFAACKNQHLESAKILVSAGADINVKNGRHRQTPVYAACVAGNCQILEYLLQSGAHVNTINGQTCETPLLYLCHCVHTDSTDEWGYVNCNSSVLKMIKLLIKYEADVNIPGGPELMTPLSVAEARADTELVDILTRHGAE